MINYSIHLKHYKKSFDAALETLKALKNPTSKDQNKILKLKNALHMKMGLPFIGRVYTFDYNAIGKNILPYYDRYPLVLVIGINLQSKTFTGLNFHYLNVEMRNKFIQHLIKNTYRSGSDLLFLKEIKILLRGINKAYFNKCIKQYNMKRIMTPLREISPILLEEINNVNDNTFMKKTQKYVQAIPLIRYYR